MRLSDDYKCAIKEGVKKFFGKNAKVILFGSRVDNNKRGGDIDLFIIPEIKLSPDERFAKKIELLTYLHSVLGEQKIDIVVSKDFNQSIEKEALKNGIEL